MYTDGESCNAGGALRQALFVYIEHSNMADEQNDDYVSLFLFW
jgi:hypothetical protein